jgi:hypothetical protein
MVLADLKGDDIILCQITSQFVKDNYAIALDSSDFKKGSLNYQISPARQSAFCSGSLNLDRLGGLGRRTRRLDRLED